MEYRQRALRLSTPRRIIGPIRVAASSGALIVLLSLLTTALAQDAAAWGEVRTLKQLPPEVRTFLIDDGPKGIADRDGKFNPTDVVSDPSVPMRRFVIAALSPERLIVEVEHGGRAHYFQKLEFRSVDHHWVFQTRSYIIGRIDDVPSLVH